jgi:predicted component of type VI protein secretion system
MELKLVVLAGAKHGTEIPLKKDQFIIGRAKECNLRAGSEAISRRHCAITRSNGQWAVRDLGSRNGTHVNDVRIEQEVPLNAGDELRVGPLKFRVDPAAAAAPATMAIPPLAPPAEVKQRKQPPVKDVADAAQRIVAQSDGQKSEDDISNWLLGTVDKNGRDAMKDTRTISMQETKTLNRMGNPIEAEETVVGNGDESEPNAESDAAADDSTGEKPEEKSGGWNLFKRGKGSTKKSPPGKLPPRTDQSSKDSREAAADIIRQMQRRR